MRDHEGDDREGPQADACHERRQRRRARRADRRIGVATRWQFGDEIVVRHRSFQGGFGVGLPVRVIEHTDERVVAFLAEDTEVAWPALEDGRGLRDVPLEERWVHRRIVQRRPWQRSDLVMIFPLGRWHSMWVFHEAGRHTGWYVNLEVPHELGPRTITTQDAILDLWIPAETGEPGWKDEDEFAVAQQVGRLTAGEAAAVRAEGERVIVERPWTTGWEGWRPPDGWSRPVLPDDWDALGS